MVYLLDFVYGFVLRMAYHLSNILLDKQNGLANHIIIVSFLGKLQYMSFITNFCNVHKYVQI